MSDRQPPRQVQRKLGDVDADSSDEDEEVGGARTPSPRAPASPCSGTSGSDEDSDKDDGSDSGSSPSVDD